MEQWRSRPQYHIGPIFHCSMLYCSENKGRRSPGAMEQWTNRPHSRNGLRPYCPMLHCSNALKMKTPGESGRFHFLVEAAGIEPASENRSIEASTCLACVLLSSVSAPTGRVAHQPALWFSPPLPRAGEEGPAHLYDALPYPVSEAREAWPLVRQPVPAVGWQLCVSHLFYEGDGTSACHLYQPRPRRNRYAPFRGPQAAANS